MLDIEQQFQQLLGQFGYAGMVEDFRRTIYQELRMILKRHCEAGKKVALKCGGVHTTCLLEDFSDILKVDCIVDREPEQIKERFKRYHIPIVSTLPQEVDAVIISSYELRQECARELQNADGPEVVDIYDELGRKGYTLTKAYYNYFKEPYRAIIECQSQYQACTVEEQKETLLARLIGDYLDIRDIPSAMQCIEEYLEQGYSKSEEMAALKAELTKLVNEIKTACRNRQHSDILWFWQDALPYEYVNDMERLGETAKTGMFFHESYTPSPVTRSVYARILDQQEEYDAYTASWPKEHKTIDLLREKGYECRKIRGIGQQSILLDNYDLHHSAVLMQPYALSELCWEALRELLLSEGPVFFLLHGGIETHIPFISPAMEKYTPFNMQSFSALRTESGALEHRLRTKRNVEYVDKEWDFFLHLLNENCVKILMSDHGEIQGKQTRICGKDLLHTVMIVVGGGLPARQYDRLFCLTNFYKLLVYILDPTVKNELDMFSDEIWLNGVDYYSKTWIDGWISSGFAELGLAYCGILTAKDRYLKLGSGEEFYHIFPDEHTNYISAPEYQERISTLRSHAGDRFIDIRKHPKFKHSHLLYEALGKKHIYEE